MPNNKLILRTLNSGFPTPFQDTTLGSVLSHADLDNNFIYLKSQIIYTASTINNILTFNKIGGESFHLDLSTLVNEFTGGTITGETIYLGDVTFENDVYVTSAITINNLNVTGDSVFSGVISACTEPIYLNTIEPCSNGDGSVTINGIVNLQFGTGDSVNNLGVDGDGNIVVSDVSGYDAGPIQYATGWSSTNTGQINLPTVEVALYNNPNNLGNIKTYTVTSGVTNSGGIPSLIDGDTNYVVIDYNGGSPIYNVYNNDDIVNDSDVVLMYVVYRSGNFIHVLEFGNYGAGLANKLNDRIMMTDRFGWESGLMISLSGVTGVVELSAGVAWNGPYRQTLVGVNSMDDVFFKNFHSGGTWTYTTTGNTLNNTYYDNGTDIVSATTGNYLVNYYYRGQEVNDHLYEVYGNGEYASVALAEIADSPSLPELITSHAFLVGRIIVEAGVSTGITQTAFGSVFQATGSAPSSGVHNDLTGLQGGAGGQYYHLTSDEYNNNAYTNVDNNFTSGQTIANYLKLGITNTITSTSIGTILSSNSGVLLNTNYSGIFTGLGNRLEGRSSNSLNSANIIGGDYNTILDTTSDSDRSIIIGGVNNDINDSTSCGIFSSALSLINTTSTYSSIIGGLSNVLNNTNNSVIIGGQNITGTTDNTVYVPNLEVRGQSNNPIYAVGTGSSFTLDFDNSNIQTITLSANTTINNALNIKDGATYTVIVKQASGGPYLINSWGTQYKFENGTTPTLGSSGTTAVDILTFISDGTNLYGLIAKNFY